MYTFGDKPARGLTYRNKPTKRATNMAILYLVFVTKVGKKKKEKARNEIIWAKMRPNLRPKKNNF